MGDDSQIVASQCKVSQDAVAALNLLVWIGMQLRAEVRRTWSRKLFSTERVLHHTGCLNSIDSIVDLVIDHDGGRPVAASQTGNFTDTYLFVAIALQPLLEISPQVTSSPKMT